MVAKVLSENDCETQNPTQAKGGLSKQARMHLRRPVRSRVFESYVRDLGEMIELWNAGDIGDSLIRETLNETMNALVALDVNFDLYRHLQRAHIVLLDRVLRDVHEIDDPSDIGKELPREKEEQIEKKVISEIDREKNQKGTAEREAPSACAD